MSPSRDDHRYGAGMPAPYLDEIQNAFTSLPRLRLALNMLGEMPLAWKTDEVREVLTGLRTKLEEKEIEQIRSNGPREYLLIKPLAPDAGEDFASKTAQHVRALDDLGLIVRLDL